MNKFIYWRPDMADENKNGRMWANIHIVAGHYSSRIKDFRELLAELQKTFPEATEENTRCEIVRKSGWCQECPVLCYDTSIPHTEYPGWYTPKTPDYYLR